MLTEPRLAFFLAETKTRRSEQWRHFVCFLFVHYLAAVYYLNVATAHHFTAGPRWGDAARVAVEEAVQDAQVAEQGGDDAAGGGLSLLGGLLGGIGGRLRVAAAGGEQLDDGEHRLRLSALLVAGPASHGHLRLRRPRHAPPAAAPQAPGRAVGGPPAAGGGAGAR